MSATDTHADETTEPLPGPTRLRPNQIAIIVGVGIALVVALSGVASAVFQFHDDSPIQREVFDNIPGPLKLAFYTVIPVMFIYGAIMFSYRMRNWQRGGPDKRDINSGNANAGTQGRIPRHCPVREPSACP